jgi:hypothetical protein
MKLLLPWKHIYICSKFDWTEEYEIIKCPLDQNTDIKKFREYPLKNLLKEL